MESGIAKLVDRQAESRDGFAEMIAAEQRTYEDREWEIHRPRRRVVAHHARASERGEELTRASILGRENKAAQLRFDLI